MQWTFIYATASQMEPVHFTCALRLSLKINTDMDVQIADRCCVLMNHFII